MKIPPCSIRNFFFIDLAESFLSFGEQEREREWEREREREWERILLYFGLELHVMSKDDDGKGDLDKLDPLNEDVKL